MCGFITSFGISFKNTDFKSALKHLSRRGPDSEGVWTDDKVFMGSRRLAIFDLNNRSNQPMKSLCSRFIIVFNGAIYNYRELREYLLKKNINLKTESDTEVILELFVLEGSSMINKLKGMFAFVIWDSAKKEAFAARDPYGIKPMYIGYSEEGLILASQVKTLLHTKFIKKDIDLCSNYSFLNLGYVLEPRTWYKDIKALKPGSFIIIKEGKKVFEEQWYNIASIWELADSFKKKTSNNNCKNKIEKALTETINQHLISDVPIGIFLSSGIDSTLIAALASINSKKKIIGITVCFDEFKNSMYDETSNARITAKKFGIEHHILRVSKEDFKNDFPKILDAMDQPSIDGINTWYASKAAAQLKLKVVFSGVGGDELLYGYDHFKTIPILFKFLKFIKKFKFLKILAKGFFNLLGFIRKDIRWKYLFKFSNSIFELWLIKRTILTEKEIISKNYTFKNISTIFNKDILSSNGPHFFRNPKIKLSQIETIYYLRNQLLRDSDWASMYHGIELRTPFVDVKLLENLKEVMNECSSKKNKLSIISNFKAHFSENLNSNKKIGFQTPIHRWFIDDKNLKNFEKNKYIYKYMETIISSLKN
tara:strand:- start:365 stop:2146 length:1782 start_codon:yes stop_codon:yes gene_type:complete